MNRTISFLSLITKLLLALIIFANSAICEKLLFLDIDGVLNNAKSDVSKLYVVEKKLLEELSKIIEATGAKIVMHSTWRYTPTTREKFNDYITAFNKKAKYKIPLPISYTPNFGTSRPEEILWWLQENTNMGPINDAEFQERTAKKTSKYQDELPDDLFKTFAGDKKLNVTNWVAIDDQDFTKENPAYNDLMKDHFVFINKKDGLTKADRLRIIDLLQGNPKK